MSIDIFVYGFEEGYKFDRLIAERALAPVVVLEMSGDYWEVRYPDGKAYSATISIDKEPQIRGFSINRPPRFPEFWNAVFDVMRQTRVIMVWPGVGPHPRCCVARADLAPDVTFEIIGELGPPAIVTCGDDIHAALELSVRG
ncbi:MAG: hypothetical protein ACLPSF_12360 [Methylocella sp.]